MDETCDLYVALFDADARRLVGTIAGEARRRGRRPPGRFAPVPAVLL